MEDVSDGEPKTNEADSEAKVREDLAREPEHMYDIVGSTLIEEREDHNVDKSIGDEEGEDDGEGGGGGEEEDGYMNGAEGKEVGGKIKEGRKEGDGEYMEGQGDDGEKSA